MPAILYETSKLHHVQGIRYRKMDLFEIKDNAPRAPDGTQPLPEAILWLLLTGEFPNTKELSEFQEDLHKKGRLSEDAENLIRSLPKDMHPMTQLSMGIMACQPTSAFAKAYHDGIHKSKYWEPTLEDAVSVCAKMPRIAAIIYHNTYKDVMTLMSKLYIG